jgi:tRNA-specific 2-thiouridylase
MDDLKKSRRVVVAMSGGVDSSVAAAMLRDQGYEVIGMMLRLWSEPGTESHNRCCTPDSMALARRVAARLDIPFYVIDAKQIFYDSVVSYFKQGYLQGNTPNPCLVCNQYIRWGFLLQHAQALGADYMATGHYVRLRKAEAGNIQILKAVDAHKDQSYVLHVLNQDQLKHALFPLGEYTKTQVREMARSFGLPVASRPDSQDLCFLGNGDYRNFLKRNLPEVQKPGMILDMEGQSIGLHEGLAFYTIGQRKGLGIASPVPLYVLEKNLNDNVLVVGPKEALGKSSFQAKEVNWVSGTAPVSPFRADVKIRYKAAYAGCTATMQEENFIQVQLDEPLRDITSGQAAVFYDGEICLGGGIIAT